MIQTILMGFPRRLKISLVLPLLGILAAASCSTAFEPEARKEFLLGTVCGISIYEKAPAGAMDRAFERIKQIENKMSVNIAESEVSAVNRNAGKAPVAVSDETFRLVSSALEFSAASGGAFDISVGALVSLWGIGTEHARIPRPDEIAKALASVDFKKIRTSQADRTIFVETPGAALDLGAIAKGWAADEAARVLKESGVRKAVVDLGGNILVLGRHPKGRPWNIGIQNPDRKRGTFLGIVRAEDASLVTSGIYERFFKGEDGKHYHHILDVKSGYPVSNGLVGVTVLARNSTTADALSTTLFSLGAEKGFELAESLQGVEALFINERNEIRLTSGMKEVFELKDADYRLIGN